MPVSTTSLDSNISGAVVGPGIDTYAYVTYDASYLYPSAYGEGAFDQIPSLLYITGDIHYGIDQGGNVVAYNLNRDGSSPIK